MIMASSSEVTSTIRELEQKGILIIGIIVVLAIFLGYILSTVLVKPFARVTKAIEDLTDGYQNEEISVPDYTETALITDAFNKMLSRMKTLDESRQEFVSNVSHELKTPMTSMKVLADSLVGQQGVPEELYQEFLCGYYRRDRQREQDYHRSSFPCKDGQKSGRYEYYQYEYQ